MSIHYFGLQYLTYDNARKELLCYFYEVKTINVNRVDQFNVRIVEGMRGFHQIKNVGLDKIFFHVQNLSCFCKFCIDGEDGPCDSET
jgi:hypothetical protein